jgi:chemotaxis protein CheY-P-specific phosphatase CheC
MNLETITNNSNIYIKEYIVENNNYPIINILDNVHIFELIYELNGNLLQKFKKELINKNQINTICYMKNLSGLILDNFYLDINVVKKNTNDCITYYVKNNDLEFDNIQFNKFNVKISNLHTSKYLIKIEYEINEEIYSKPVVNLFKKIMIKLFSNLETYLCKITT